MTVAGVILLSFLFSCSVRDAGEQTRDTERRTDTESETATAPATEESTASGEVLGEKFVRAEYLGVRGSGDPETVVADADDFEYLFSVDGEETAYRIAPDPDYTVQNALKRGKTFDITLEDGFVTDAREVGTAKAPETLVSGIPGEKTVKNFIATALSPVGQTLYVYGGGWNWQDDGSSRAAASIGVSPDWAEFFGANDAGYAYRCEDGSKPDYFPSGGFNEYWFAGLDCSGYVGWCVYNTLNEESGGEGYVTASTGFARSLAERGYGKLVSGTPVPTLENYRPGDIVSIKGHVFIVVGVCTDGSVVIAHSTVTKSRTGDEGGGVQISAVGYSKACEAYAVADRFMTENYPEWNERYETDLKDPALYFPGESGSYFTWSDDLLSDPDGIRTMTPRELLKLFY